MTGELTIVLLPDRIGTIGALLWCISGRGGWVDWRDGVGCWSICGWSRWNNVSYHWSRFGGASNETKASQSCEAK